MADKKLLLFDFDGTICLGDDPVLEYATQVDELLKSAGLFTADEPERTVSAAESGVESGIRDTVQQALRANNLLSPAIKYTAEGTPLGVESRVPEDAGRAHPTSWPLQDGYQLVQLLGVQAGLSAEETGLAFRRGREALLRKGLAESDVHAPVEIHALLTRVREPRLGAEVVPCLVTNSPAQAFSPWLEHLDLVDAFDVVIHGARKPFGMPDAIARVEHECGVVLPGYEILSIGDIWANDLEYVHSLGGTTILIDRFGTGLGSPDHSVNDFSAAVGLIEEWLGR